MLVGPAVIPPFGHSYLLSSREAGRVERGPSVHESRSYGFRLTVQGGSLSTPIGPITVGRRFPRNQVRTRQWFLPHDNSGKLPACGDPVFGQTSPHGIHPTTTSRAHPTTTTRKRPATTSQKSSDDDSCGPCSDNISEAFQVFNSGKL